MPQPPLEPVDPQDATWPVLEERNVYVDREPTVVDPAPPSAIPPRDGGIGAGLLLGLGILALVAAGIGVAYLLTHRGNDAQATTVVVTSPPVTSAPAVTASAAVSATKGVSTPRQTASTSPATTTAARVTTPAPVTPANATVPDVGGQTEQSAVTSFSRAGVLPSLAFVPSQDPLGTVEGQAKPAGSTVAYHTHIQVNISRGPGTKPNVSVADVVGKPLADAVTALNGAHLRLIYVRFPLTSRSQAGTIVQQSPLGGSQAPENAQVLVFLGAYRG